MQLAAAQQVYVVNKSTQCLCVCVRHGKNINSDMWRQMQLWRGAGNPAHPFCRFHTGNRETLMSGPKAGVQPCSADLAKRIAASPRS